MERRLATGDANAIELAYSFLEETQKFICLIATRLRKVFFAWLDKLRVVTKRASQNTAKRKRRCGELPGIIEEGQRLVSGEVHTSYAALGAYSRRSAYSCCLPLFHCSTGRM